MIRNRAFGLCVLAVSSWSSLGFAQSLSAINGEAAVRSALEVGRAQGWEVLYNGQGRSPHGPDLVFRDPATKIIHAFESKANQSPLKIYHGHLQGTQSYAIASAREAIGRSGLSSQQKTAYQAVLETEGRPGMLRTYVARTPVVAGQSAGATALKEVAAQLTKPRQYLDDAGKVAARGIILLVIAKDVSDGAHRALEIERLYEEGQFDEFSRDLEQVRNAARTGGKVAGTIAGLWFGAKAGAALGALAGSVAGPVGSAVAGTVGAVVVGVACYVGGETVAVYVSELVSEQAPGFVQSVVSNTRAVYHWVEDQVAWLWEGSWAQTGYLKARRAMFGP